MQIQGLQATSAIQSAQRAGQPNGSQGAPPAGQAPRTGPTDSIQLSAEAQQLSQAQATGETTDANGIRSEKVAALRQAIADGSYDTHERMSAALDKMLDTFA